MKQKLDEDLEFIIIEQVFKQTKLQQIATSYKITKDQVIKVIMDNSTMITQVITSKLPTSLRSKINKDVFDNIKLYNQYILSLSLTPEVLDLKTKNTYLQLLSLSTTSNFTKAQATALSSLLSYFSKNILNGND